MMSRNFPGNAGPLLAAATTLMLWGCGAAQDGDSGTEATMDTVGYERDCEVIVGGHCIKNELEDECGLDTGYSGDVMCIKPPSAEEGFQMHIGPDEYTAEAIEGYLLPPGQEGTSCVWVVTPNDTLRTYYERIVHMRPVSHHLITSVMPHGSIPSGYDGGWADCGDTDSRTGSLGGSETVQQLYPANGVYPPEFADVGRTLNSNAVIRLELHYINTTDVDVLREMWMNVYYKDRDSVQQWVGDINIIGGFGARTAPGEHNVNINTFTLGADARIVSFFGHYHAHTTRFSIWRQRGEELMMTYEDYDWFDPATFNYDTITDNPKPDPDLLMPGASSGILDFQKGDRLYWECEVVNDSDITLTFKNEALTGEMCNVFGEFIGGGLGQGGSPGREISIEEYNNL